MMSRWTLERALLATSACVVLLSMAPATAGAWMERLSGTMGAYSPSSRTVILEIPWDGEEIAGKGGLGRPPLLFLSGVLLGLLLGLLLSSLVPQRWHSRQRRQRDIDRLTEEFQALFRKIDQGE